jgi:hypothetical protein
MVLVHCGGKGGRGGRPVSGVRCGAVPSAAVCPIYVSIKTVGTPAV